MKLLSSFRFNITLRVVILVLLSFGLAAVFFYTSWFFTPLVLGILIVVTILNLVHYQESTNRDITNFLIALKQGSFTNRFTPKHKGKSFDQLSELFQEINKSFHEVSMEKESHYQYLQALNENIGVAIISYLDDGKLQLVNPSAKSLFNKPILNQLSDIRLIAPDVHGAITELGKHGGSRSIKAAIAGKEHELSIVSKQFVSQNETFHVVLIQDIKKELDYKESESWQKLVRVLTHEIMNSVTPIISLSKAVNTSISSTDLSTLSHEDKEDLITSIQTIENRSNGMLKFVNAYKEYARDIELQKEEVNIAELLAGIEKLFAPIFAEKDIELNILITPSSFNVLVDKELIEQVIINLVKNAVEALEKVDDKRINIHVGLENQQCQILVRDSGLGISEDIIHNIFVPFFTTKRKGSGVGLSISRKVMQLHGGSLDVEVSKAGSTFTMVLPADI